MGFIFGIYNFNNKRAEKQEIENFGNAVKYDNQELVTEVNNNFALGYSYHSDRKTKPIIYNYENYTIIADIHIFNPEYLKTFFHYENNAEAFIKSFIKWGNDCANYINGEFAVVIIDNLKNKVHLFRDHIGIRPLTYFFDGSKLIFASHQFAIQKLVKSKLCEKMIVYYDSKIKKYYNYTFFENIYKVIPGYSIVFSTNYKKENKYWKPENIKINKSLSYDDSVKKLRELIVKATLNRVEEGKIGIHISGGIDSTGVGAILADNIENNGRMIGYSWTPDELNEVDLTLKGGNEKEFIDEFSKGKNIEIKYTKTVKHEFIDDSLIPEFESMFIEHPTMKLAFSDNVSTLFSGWGGDEFVSISTRGVYNYLFFSFKWIELLKLILKYGINRFIGKFRIEILPLLVPFGLVSSFGNKINKQVKLYKFAFILKHFKSIFFADKKNIFGYGSRTKFMINLLENYHIPERIDSWSLFSEKYKFEYKYPLLDKDVLEFWFSIPLEYNYKDMKARLLYKEAMKGILTESIRTRNDKSENLRIQYTFKNIFESKEYTIDLLKKIEAEDHISIYKVEKFYKLYEEYKNKPYTEYFRFNNLLINYLRLVYLKKKYCLKK